MSQQRRGLGKGLGALIPTGPVPGSEPVGGPSQSAPLAEVNGARFAELPVKSIAPNPRQPRDNFDDDAIKELAASIGIVGLLQPIVVREAGPEDYELIMGERRLRASRLAGLESIPAIVRETSDTDLLRDALMENLHRQELNALEEAAAYRQLLDDFGATHEELATRIGRSRPHISNTLRLLNLPPAVQNRVAAGVLSAGHARALLSLGSTEAQEHLASRVVAEGLSVRAVEEIIATRDAEPKASAPRRVGSRKPAPPVLRELADRLSDRYETKVSVDQGKRKGKIVVEFASIDDLERIIKVMAPDAAGFAAAEDD
ncbi:ParB/RepB/Spo0J family partition protein [Actinomadura alba]|uniref:ParB/RepB/Spo0J family partition protein n=1 Tax=Actinomadura alba TaxID=406431 RepID=A0ABR7LMX8_9ACTN|nr:ParB/RepB/Spo0J family partition protein [Actinomadura alba]MBC6466178.1 ParB/RepB/Spo0J family partition protein [Actinomadura alba]